MKILKYVLLCCLIVGCSVLPTSFLGGNQTAIIKAQIIDSGFTTKTVQSVYTSASINHLELRLLAMPSGTVLASKEIPQADLSKNITFSNLRANTSYQVKAIAYKTTGTSASDIISTDDASSSVDFTTTNNDAPTLATLKVQLVDKLFNGQGTSSIAVTAGGYTTGDSLIGVSFAGRVASLAGISPSYDGIGTNASVYTPGAGVFYNGYIYVVDRQNPKIRRINPITNEVTTIAGGSQGNADGIGSAAQFNNPKGLVGYNGCLYVADTWNYRVRKVDLSTNAVTTIAGSSYGYAEGIGTAAQFKGPTGIAIYNGCLYVSDDGNFRIRKIDLATNEVTTAAGCSTRGVSDGTGSGAQFYGPQGLVLYNGYLYAGDDGYYRIRRLNPVTNEVTTIAGSSAGSADGIGTAAQFKSAYQLTAYNGALYVADAGNYRIRKVDLSNNEVTTIAGSTQGFADAVGTSAKFNTPTGLVAYSGCLYISDEVNNRIRKLDLATNAVTTITGVSGTYSDGVGPVARFYYPHGMAMYNGYLYVTDTSNRRIRRINPMTYEVTTIAGSTQGTADGVGTNAQFSVPSGITAYNGALYVTDDCRIRKIDLGTNDVTTIAGGTYGTANGMGAGAQFSGLADIAAYNDALYVSDNVTLIRKVDLANNNNVTTIAGTWYDYYGEGMSYFADGVGTSAQFCNPQGLAVYNGYLYIADSDNCRIRKLNLATNEVTTVAGNGIGASVDGVGINAQLIPAGLTIYNGCLYFVDSTNRVRKMDLATNTVSTLAGGTSGFANGLGTNARFNNPYGVAFDSDGNIYVTDTQNHMIRAIY